MRKILSILLLLLSSTLLYADYEDGLAAGIRGDYQAVINEWTPLSETGHVKAQFNLGYMYSNGMGVYQDDQKAIKWYTAAAEQGNEDAIFYLKSDYGIILNDNKNSIHSFLEDFNKNEINKAPSRVYNSNYSSQTLQTIEMNDRFDELYDQQQKLILMQQQRAEDERHRLKTERINSLRYNGYNAAYPVMRQGIDTKKPWQTYKQPKARPVRSVVPASW